MRNLISSLVDVLFCRLFLLTFTSSRELFIFLYFTLMLVVKCVYVFLCYKKERKQYKSVRSIFSFLFVCGKRARSSTLEMISPLIGPFHFYTFPDVNFAPASPWLYSFSSAFSLGSDVTSIIDAKVLNFAVYFVFLHLYSVFGFWEMVTLALF